MYFRSLATPTIRALSSPLPSDITIAANPQPETRRARLLYFSESIANPGIALGFPPTRTSPPADDIVSFFDGATEKVGRTRAEPSSPL